MNVLFLCTGNSARSILAEALTNSLAVSKAKFRAYSAGSHPKGAAHPLAIELLAQSRIPTSGLRSKSWDEFAAPGVPVMDFVVTVCDQWRASSALPARPAHDGTPGHARPRRGRRNGRPKRRAFSETANMLRRRIEPSRASLRQADRLRCTSKSRISQAMTLARRPWARAWHGVAARRRRRLGHQAERFRRQRGLALPANSLATGGASSRSS